MPTSLTEFRRQYPQYNDMPDAALADAIHAKFYSDLPREEFGRRLGIEPAALETSRPPSNREGGPPDPNQTPNVAPRTGDALKPYFGGHNPVAEVYDTFAEPLTEISSPRPVKDRVIDTVNFAASVPFHALRLPSPGEMIESATGLPGARESEQRFIENNPKIVGALQAAGEIAPGVAPMPSGRVAPTRRGTPAEQARAEPPTTVEPAAFPDSGPARARAYVRDLDELGISRHGPAVAQAARDSEGLGTVAKVVESMPVVSGPLRKSTNQFVQSAARAGDNIAGEYSAGGGNIARAGDTLRSYLDDFKNERSLPRDAVEAMTDAEVNALAQRVPREIRSLKTAQDARYEAAWRHIPERMRRGRAEENEPRLMGGMAETRAVLEDIAGRNQRMTLQSGTNAAPAGATAPIASGGLLGEIVRAITHRASNGRYPWTATLQTMRDVRSTVRRIGSRTADTEANTLSKADLQRMEGAITQDMVGLMARIADGARSAGNTTMATGFERAMRGFQDADRFTRRYAEAFEGVKRLTRASKDEQAIGTILQAAQAGAKGDRNLLLQLKRIAPPEVLDDVAAAVINEMGRPTGRAAGITQDAGWSLSKFAAQWNAMSLHGRHMVFGHRPAVFHRLQRFANVLQGMADYEALANVSKSGTHGIVGTIVLAGPAALIGNLQGILLSAGAAYGAARWMTSPAYISWLTRSTEVQNGIWRGRIQGRAATARVREQANELRHLIKSDRLIDPDIAANLLIGVDRALAGEPTAAATAEPEQTARNDGTDGPALSAYDPTIKERAGTWLGQLLGDTRDSHEVGRQLAEALDALSLFSLSAVSESERHIREGVQNESPLQVARGVGEAALPFLPGIRFGGKAVARLGEEIAALEKEVVALTGQPLRSRPRPIPGTPQADLVKYDQAYRDRLANEVAGRRRELDAANARNPRSTSVPDVDPRPMQAERSFVMDEIEKNPYVQAIKGRQGFPTKTEQKALIEQYFKGGGRLPPAPWGATPQSEAGETARDILAVAFASKPRVEQRAIVEGARQKLVAANQQVSRLSSELADASRLSSEQVTRLKADLAGARREAAEHKSQRDFYKSLLDKLVPGRGRD